MISGVYEAGFQSRTPSWQFNTYSRTDYVPVGFGFGKVLEPEGNYVANAYVEAQPSIIRSGRGAPIFHIETGVQIRFTPSVASGLKF